jgi:hypothetical protein
MAGEGTPQVRLIKADSIMSWKTLKESRALRDAEDVDWTMEPYSFTANDLT